MTKISKSEVMRLAWRLFKTSQMHGNSDWYARHNTIHHTFGSALRQAWVAVKERAAKVAAQKAEARANGLVPVDEIRIGDVLHIENYGGYEGNSFEGTVTKIEPEEKWTVFYITKVNGFTLDVCGEPGDAVKRLSTAVEALQEAA